MKRAQGAIIGLVIPHIRLAFYGAVTRALAAACRKLSFQIMLSVTEDNPEIEQSSVRALVEARAAGIVIMPTLNCRAETMNFLKLVSTVQIMRHQPRVSANVVRFGDAQGIRDATEHLLSLGHLDIGFIGASPETAAGRLRLSAFEAAVNGAGLAAQKTVYTGPTHSDFGETATGMILDARERPSALLVGSSEITPGVLKVIKRRRIDVPKELSILTYGDHEWLELFLRR